MSGTVALSREGRVQLQATKGLDLGGGPCINFLSSWENPAILSFDVVCGFLVGISG